MKELSPATRYRGRRTEAAGCIIERLNPRVPGVMFYHTHWQKLSPAPSLRLRNHSPSGFEWGYGGSGPAQTALALLLDFTRDRDVALATYQTVKRDLVARFDDKWELTGADLSAALTAAQVKEMTPCYPSPCCGLETEFVARRGGRDLRRCPCGQEHVL